MMTQADKLAKALKFYASGNHFTFNEGDPIIIDDGSRAEKALAEYEASKEEPQLYCRKFKILENGEYELIEEETMEIRKVVITDKDGKEVKGQFVTYPEIELKVSVGGEWESGDNY